MATVTLNFPDLVKLIGIELSLDKVREVMFELGSETEDIQGDEVTFEVTSDRADLLSEEGIARMLRAYYEVKTGLAVPKLLKSDYKLIVSREVEPVRPYVTGAIVRDVHFTDESIKSLMHLQEKLHGTFGRKRKKGAVGVHDLSKIKGKEIHYRAVPGDSVKFVPLQSTETMTLTDVLTKHPKGIEFRYVLEDKKLMPIIVDDEAIFSFPPIINSKRTEVSINTHDLLIELTGEDLRTIDYMLNIVLYSLDLRGATIYTLDVVYPDETLKRPNFNIRTMDVEVEYINRILGLELTAPDIKHLLERMGFGILETASDYLTVEIPPYRTDILHRRDVVDDVGRAFGYNNIIPSYPNTPSAGKLTETTKLGDAIRNTLVGQGLQDTFNFILIGKDEAFTKMNLHSDGKVVEISNPYAEQYNIVRPSLIPSLMIVLSNNLHREYPQNIFEVGSVAHLDHEENTGVKELDHVACTLCYSKAGYNEIKSKLQALCLNFGKLEQLKTVPADHLSFIPGRCAEIWIGDRKAGVIGEISPVVLKNWGIEMPIAAFEMEIAALK